MKLQQSQNYKPAFGSYTFNLSSLKKVAISERQLLNDIVCRNQDSLVKATKGVSTLITPKVSKGKIEALVIGSFVAPKSLGERFQFTIKAIVDEVKAHLGIKTKPITKLKMDNYSDAQFVAKTEESATGAIERFSSHKKK